MAFDSHSVPRFFVLEHEMGGRHDTEFLSDDRNVGDAPRCPTCGDIVGMLAWLPPYRGELMLHGGEAGDFARGYGNGFLVSRRLADAFRAEGLDGLSGFHLVEVTHIRRRRKGKKAAEVPEYLFVVPSFASAAVDEARSRIWRSDTITCMHCRETGVDAVQGFSLEEGTWEGEDVFRPRGQSGSIVVSERFERFVARHGFTNMRMTPTEKYVWDPLGRFSTSPGSEGSA